MKILNFKKSALRNARVALNANEESMISTVSMTDELGTKANPYSLWEMCELIKAGKWRGGYVLFMGKVEYIEEDQFVLGEAKDGTSNYTIVQNEDDDSSEFVEPSYLDPNLPIFKPSSDFDITQAGHSPESSESSESSNIGSNIAIAGKNYQIYHDTIVLSEQCVLSVDQTVFEKYVLVSISTLSPCKESDIPTMRCALSTSSNYVVNAIYLRSNSTFTLNKNSLVASFGYYRIDGQQVAILVDDEKGQRPVYSTAY